MLQYESPTSTRRGIQDECYFGAKKKEFTFTDQPSYRILSLTKDTQHQKLNKLAKTRPIA